VRLRTNIKEGDALIKELIAHLGVDNEIQVALPVALFFVGEPFELVGQGQERFGEHGPFVHVHRQFAFLRALHAGDGYRE